MRWALFFAALLFAANDLPPIPPLPNASWPLAEVAEPFARALVAQVPAGELAQRLKIDPELTPRILRNLGTALMTDDASLRRAVEAYVVELGRASAATSSDVRVLASIAAIDPVRYLADEAFRARIDALLPRAVAAMPPAIARALLDELTDSARISFDVGEAIAAQAHLATRNSSARRVEFDRQRILMPDDIGSPIEASFYSLNSSFFSIDEAKQFLAAVHASAPSRRLVVLADAAMRDALPPPAVFIDTHRRLFTPWPRDPFIAAHAAGGSVVFVNRPNAQRDREDDQNMTRAIVQELPAPIDAAWKQPRWTVSPTPFHNGQMLITPAAVWITIHTVELRAMQLLGVDHVPVETFGDAPGVERYLAACRRAAEELQRLYGKPVRFAHRMDADPQLIGILAGGAGIDLDSILTLLPRGHAKADALVGDIHLGVEMVRKTPLVTLRRVYGFRDDPELLRKEIIDAQGNAAALQAFLDEIAAELRRDGMTVRRLPLLSIPDALLARADVPQDFSFLLTWNNVVLERGRAEGFASLLAAADAKVKETFAASGYKLVLFPPLVRSVILGGGYRCASNHLRRVGDEASGR